MPNNSHHEHEINPDDPVSSLSSALKSSNDPCETKGVRANRNRVFVFKVEAEQLYDLLDLLRRLAVANESYSTVVRAVQAERMLYDQARHQGF